MEREHTVRIAETRTDDVVAEQTDRSSDNCGYENKCAFVKKYLPRVLRCDMTILLCVVCLSVVCHEASAWSLYDNGCTINDAAVIYWSFGRIRVPSGIVAKSLCMGMCILFSYALVSAWRRRNRQCYLVDYSCYKAADDRKINTDLAEYFLLRNEHCWSFDNVQFKAKIHLSSGLGQETYAPNYLFSENPVPTIDEGMAEMDEVFAGSLDDLFAKTSVCPSDVDILVVTVSTFAPSPSLAAWIVNRYKMKENIKVFNLGGMGCSASLIAVDLVKDLLRVYPNSYAIVVSSECTTANPYPGNEKSMMITECLFRVGAAAMLFSNKRSEAKRAKMQLMHLVRTHIGANNTAYGCVSFREDDEGISSIFLSPDLLVVAPQALKKNLLTLGPKVLPIAEQLRYLYNQFCIKVLRNKEVEEYVPNFNLAFQHYCIQPGGRAVVSGIGKSLGLTDYEVEPSRMTLHRFGNTSSSGLWYELAYLEAKERLRKGDRIWAIGLGAGFKCNTAVWKVKNDMKPMYSNVWMDTIERYPCDTRNPFQQVVENHLSKFGHLLQ